MIDLHAVLRDRYLTPLKAQPELYIGVELEFPIVHRGSQATDIEVSKALMPHLLTQGFELVQSDEQGAPVAVRHPETGDVILFELSYNTLEMAFAKAKTINQVATRFQTYLTLIQDFLRSHNHELQGCGIHPHCQLNDNRPVALPRYQMLMAYLALGANEQSCHPFTDYGAFICGNQVQFDLSRETYLRVLNVFNQIEAAKAYLFPNSAFDGVDWDTTIARDYFWEDSMHGLIRENVGIYPHDFETEDAYLQFISQSAIFTTERQGQILYFPPRRLEDYFASQELVVRDLTGETHRIQPDIKDLAYHRSYHYQVLTKRGTMELRSVCTQPLDQTFAPTAFQLGLLVNLEKVEAYLATCDFFVSLGRDYPSLRKTFSKKVLTEQEKNKIRSFCQELLELAREGLVNRGYGEEKHLSIIMG